MENANDEFVSVNEFTPNWNPRSTGTKKEGNRQDLAATELSFIVGWYLGSREVTIDNKQYTVHKILANKVGDQSHLGEPLAEGEAKQYEFFGTGVLNNQLAEHVTEGQYVRIKWLGMTQPKKQGGSAYHGWDVGVSSKTEPIAVQNGIPVGNSPGNSTEQMAAGAPADNNDAQPPQQETAAQNVAPGDDLPF